MHRVPGVGKWSGAGYPAINRLFTFACFSMPPILGSTVSFVWHGGALWCLFAICSGRRKFNRDTYMLLFTALLYLYVGANIISFLINEPSWQTATKLVPLGTFILFPFSYSLLSIASKEDLARAAAFASMVASYGALLLALVQHFVFDVRPEGAAGNALIFASVTCMAGGLSLAGALMLKTERPFALAGGYLAAVLAVILSGSRSIWFVIGVIGIVIALVCYRQLRALLHGHILKVMAALALIVVLSSGILVHRIESLADNWADLSAEGDYDSSLGLRLALWRVGAEQFMEHPFLGSGLQHTREIISAGMTERYDLSVSYSHFHNGFLTLLVEAGLFGGGAIIALFLLAAWMALQTLRKSDNEYARFGAMVLLVFLLNYGIGGSFNLIIGQDIADTMFMIFLITGLFLARGTALASRKPEERITGLSKFPQQAPPLPPQSPQ